MILRRRVSEYLVPEIRSLKVTTGVWWESDIHRVSIRQTNILVSIRQTDGIYHVKSTSRQACNIQENSRYTT